MVQITMYTYQPTELQDLLLLSQNITRNTNDKDVTKLYTKNLNIYYFNLTMINLLMHFDYVAV